MTSSTDFQKLWFFYKTEGSPNGISINDFCLNRGVSYSEFEKWYKKDMRCKAPRVASIIRPRYSRDSYNGDAYMFKSKNCIEVND
jgi:hypothetical protein